MSFRTNLLAVVEAARAISGPAGVDIRTNQLTVRTRVWSGNYVREGVFEDSDLVLPAHYPIRRVSGQDIEGSGGTYDLDTVLVNHITPFNGVNVGYTPAQLDPPKRDDRTEVIYVITGPEGGEYELVEARFHRPFSYQLVLRRKLPRADG